MDAWLSSAAARRAALSRVWMEGRLGRGKVVGCGSVRSMERCWVVGFVGGAGRVLAWERFHFLERMGGRRGVGSEAWEFV